MTNVKTLLFLLSDGEFRTIKEIVSITGLTRIQVEGAVRHLVRDGFADPVPVAYVLNASGFERAARPDPKFKTPAQKRITHAEAQARFRERQKTGERGVRLGRIAKPKIEATAAVRALVATLPPDTLTKRAIASRPLLQAFWSVAA